MVWQERIANKETKMSNPDNFETILDFPEHYWEVYSQVTRNYAANTLLDALLDSCESQEERIELSVNLLGYDPR
jgi:hypothetical protein